MEAPTRPEIFVFCLASASQQSLFRDVHSHLVDVLEVKSTIRLATNIQDALEVFDQNDRPEGVLVTDPGIIESRNVAVPRKLASYVRNGGTLVLGGLFSTEIRPNDSGKYTREKWDLPWKAILISGPCPNGPGFGASRTSLQGSSCRARK